MREIKFRAWIEKDKCMLLHSEFDIQPTFPSGVRIITYSSKWVERGGEVEEIPTEEIMDDAIIMQYTGLKDKNGVEIYEGDILSQPINTSYRFKYSGLVRYESDYGGFIVEGQYSKNQHHETLTCDVAFDCEIIGNIHEYPHMLTYSGPTSISVAPQ